MGNKMVIISMLAGMLMGFTPVLEAKADEEVASAQHYRYALADLHVARDYLPMKNSFVVGLEVLSDRPRQLEAGGRKTILEAEGQGSLRHIWQTHGPGAAPFRIEFFVDGEENPSVAGNWDDLIAAAKACEQSFLPLGASLIPEASKNWYLPVPFEESLRVDLVPTSPLGLVFLQLDYRLEDDSMEGVRLAQEDGDPLRLYYEGVDAMPEPPATPELRTERQRITGSGGMTLEGPGIIRRLGLNAQRTGARIQVRYDDAESWSVDADIADFFGPFRGTALNNNQAYFPMPFAESVEIYVEGATPGEEWILEVDVEDVDAFAGDWRYFHAISSAEENSGGYLPYLMLFTEGRGHWVGLSLYDSGHDHGGGDFAVVDGRTDNPAMLHGINGEDYFSFAFFGKGENFPYSEAFTNEAGRFRVHIENPYPFRESLELSWAVHNGVSPHGVAYWYHDEADRAALPREAALGRTWQVFGPVDAPMAEGGFSPDTTSAEALFASLPDPASLDAGEAVEATHHMFNEVFRGAFEGWATQPAIGPHLNLMYVYGHVMDLGGEHHMGAYARNMMAQTTLEADTAQSAYLELTYDDPIQVVLNGAAVYQDLELRQGFTTTRIPVDLEAGDNELLLRICDTPNNNTSWAGVLLQVLDADGNLLN